MSQHTSITIRSKGDSKATTMVLPIVKSISRSTTASLTEVSTMVYGFRNNFCMDLGTTRRFTIRFERVNPFPYDDSSDDYSHSTSWSNGKWYRMLENLLDRWQNLCVDPSNPSELAGGFRFLHIPEDETLYPRIDGNVFMVGNLSMRYKTPSLLEFTLPLTLSRMTGTTTPVEPVTLTLVTEDIVNKTTRTTTVEVPKGYETGAPQCPDDWDEYQPGRVFQYWTDSDGNPIYEGEMHIWNSDATLYANWKGVHSIEDVFESKDVIVPAGVTRAKAYLVGGGGGAGGGLVRATGSDIAGTRIHRVGGGGGAGQVILTTEITVRPGATISVTIGKGGQGGRNIPESSGSPNSSAGDAGGDTSISYDGRAWPGDNVAKGGAGGARATPYADGAGGAQYFAGGTTEGLTGGDGSTEGPNIEDNVGKGGNGVEYSENARIRHIRNGGSGGGAAAFRYRFYVDHLLSGSGPSPGWKPNATDPDEYYASKGGDGQTFVEGSGNTEHYATDGIYGGGGGSGFRENSLRSGSGGDGVAIIVYFEG